MTRLSRSSKKVGQAPRMPKRPRRMPKPPGRRPARRREAPERDLAKIERLTLELRELVESFEVANDAHNTWLKYHARTLLEALLKEIRGEGEGTRTGETGSPSPLEK